MSPTLFWFKHNVIEQEQQLTTTYCKTTMFSSKLIYTPVSVHRQSIKWSFEEQSISIKSWYEGTINN